jgi:transposase
VVLGGGHAGRGPGGGAPGPPAGSEGVQLPPGEERREGRRRLGGLAADGAAAGGVGLLPPGPRAAGVDPLPDQAGAAAHQWQRPGPCRAGQAGYRSHLYRHLRVWGNTWLDGLALPEPYGGKVASLRKICALLAGEIALAETAITARVEQHPGYRAVRTLPGIGPVLAAVIVAEIGDITRFPGPGQLCSWAGLTSRHRESDTKVSRGHITKQGSPILRWALIEAIQHVPAGHPLRQRKDDILARRGKEAKNIAKVATARQLLTWVYYAMRDGQVRDLARPTARQAA